MWKEAFASKTDIDRMPAPHFADDVDCITSRRASGASDDSFDASSYIHVANKLDMQVPKVLLNDGQLAVGNHFSKPRIIPVANHAGKNGKRVIRRRISVYELNACRMRTQNNANNNSSAVLNPSKTQDLSNSSSSDSDSLTKSKRMTTHSLSAKIELLMCEMKRLRQLDKDVLRQFLLINDTIEEQRWLLEEKQEAIKCSLSEEGENPVAVNFDLPPPEVAPENPKGDKESVQSLSPSPDSRGEVIDEALPVKQAQLIKEAKRQQRKDSDLVSTSSDSALSMSGVSSTLSSTTSLPVSNRSSSPPTSSLSTTSASSSYIDSMEKRAKQGAFITRTEPVNSNEQDFENDIEGYCRMYGASMKRGSCPLPRQARSFDSGYAKTRNCDDYTADSAYSTRRGSTDSDSRDAAEYAMAVRRSIENRSFNASFRPANDVQLPARSRSDTKSKQTEDTRNRVQRISVLPDGTREPTMGVSVPAKRTSSLNDKKSAAYRLLQHPAHQRHIARMNINRRLTYLSFVPIVEHEPDMMLKNGRHYSNDSDSAFESERRDYQNLADLSKLPRNRNGSRQVAQEVFVPIAEQGPVSIIENGWDYSNESERVNSQNSSNQRPRLSATRQCPPVIRKPPVRSMKSSSSKSSAHSQSKSIADEVERRCPRPHREPVWVQRRENSVHSGKYATAIHEKKTPNPHAYKDHQNQGVHNLSEESQETCHSKLSKRASMPHITPPFRHNSGSSNVLTVSYKPNNKSANQAVYNWIQTQDDVTYL